MLGLTDDPTPVTELTAKLRDHKAFDYRLRLAIEAVEEALDGLHLEMEPRKKAELIFRVYKYFETDESADRYRVLEWITDAA